MPEASDAETVEGARAMMQEMIDRAFTALDGGAGLEEMFAATGGVKEFVTVAADDVREIGHFELVFPRLLHGHRTRRQWVYRRKDGSDIVYVLDLPKRTQLRQRGAAQLLALRSGDSTRN